MSIRKVLAVCTSVLIFFLASCTGGGEGVLRTGSPPSTAAGLRKSPYLIYNGKNTQMTVLWQTKVPGKSTLSWGTNTSYSTGAKGVSQLDSEGLFRHTITGLTPGQKYYYRFELSDRTATGSFVAAPAENGPTTLFLYGDTRTNPADHDRVAAGMVSSYLANPADAGNRATRWGLGSPRRDIAGLG